MKGSVLDGPTQIHWVLGLYSFFEKWGAGGGGTMYYVLLRLLSGPRLAAATSRSNSLADSIFTSAL